MNVFLTGASGFVGSAVARHLILAGHRVRAALRRQERELVPGIEPVFFDDITRHDWATALVGQTQVVHCAARVHVMNEQSIDPLDEFRKINVQGTLSLARAAAKAGVKRFVFISSIKVNGDSSAIGQPFCADDQVNPVGPYGISKHEAEMQLLDLAAHGDMQVTVIRPVLVYGPGVKANFLHMMGWLNRGLPLPLGALRNKRSLLALDNLVDLISTCMVHPAAANQVFLASDGEDLTTTQLLRYTASALGKSANLIPVPAWALNASLHLLGKPGIAQRLCGTLQVDISKNRRLLGWEPPARVDDALRETARNFLEQR